MPKKLKIVVGTNSLTLAKHKAYSNHCQIWFRLGRSTPHEYAFVNPDRMSIDRMRNMCAETALSWDSDYLLFLDDDVIVPWVGLELLIKANADIAAGDVMIRGYPFNHMCFRYMGKTKSLKSMPTVPKKLGLISVDAVGFSFCLIKTSLLRKLPKPYFVTGVSHTEDIYFCLKAVDLFPKTTIKVDTRIQCDHILWDESIGPQNSVNYAKYYRNQFPKDCEEVDADRGERYLNLMKQAVK